MFSVVVFWNLPHVAHWLKLDTTLLFCLYPNPCSHLYPHRYPDLILYRCLVPCTHLRIVPLCLSFVHTFIFISVSVSLSISVSIFVWVSFSKCVAQSIFSHVFLWSYHDHMGNDLHKLHKFLDGRLEPETLARSWLVHCGWRVNLLVRLWSLAVKSRRLANRACSSVLSVLCHALFPHMLVTTYASQAYERTCDTENDVCDEGDERVGIELGAVYVDGSPKRMAPSEPTLPSV